MGPLFQLIDPGLTLCISFGGNPPEGTVSGRFIVHADQNGVMLSDGLKSTDRSRDENRSVFFEREGALEFLVRVVKPHAAGNLFERSSRSEHHHGGGIGGVT